MVNYSNGKIYKIVSDTSNLIYVGSTTKNLSARLVDHRSDYRCWKKDNTKPYTTSFKVLENDNFKIVLLETVKCNTKDELSARERFYIESMVCVNKVIPLRSQKEYEQTNKESIMEYKKKYREINKESIAEKNRKNYEDNKELFSEKNRKFYEDNKESIIEYQKERYEKNKDEINKKKKEYRDTNRDEINKKKREKYAERKIAYMELYPLLFPK
tara:strand:- start:30 stop:671 length:642 start_codon:yes stop_codon:yes gene_type:complete